MARSNANPTSALIETLARDYEIRDEPAVAEFLAEHPDVPALLAEIRPVIRHYFGNDAVRLDVLEDPECEATPPELLVNVLLHAAPLEALDLLRQFQEEWWLTKRRDSGAPVMVSIALQGRV